MIKQLNNNFLIQFEIQLLLLLLIKSLQNDIFKILKKVRNFY